MYRRKCRPGDNLHVVGIVNKRLAKLAGGKAKRRISTGVDLCCGKNS
jgi:hypothetical protein